MKYACKYNISLTIKNQKVKVIDYGYILHAADDDSDEWSINKETTKCYAHTEYPAEKNVYDYTRAELLTGANSNLSQSIAPTYFDEIAYTGSYTITTSGSDNYDTTTFLSASSTTEKQRYQPGPANNWYEITLETG